jgi:fibronectin type 3 domain-containing protein
MLYAAGVLYTGHPASYSSDCFYKHRLQSQTVKGLGKKKKKTISSIQIKMKFSVDVQTESCISPCSSSVKHVSFGAKAVSWDIQVINVKSNLFNNDNEDMVNVRKDNDQIIEIKVGELTSADEEHKTKIGTTEEQAGINIDVENDEDAKCSFITRIRVQLMKRATKYENIMNIKMTKRVLANTL